MALAETLISIADGFMNLVRTRASVNLDNITEVGKGKITAVAGGIPKTTISNVILSAKNQTSSIANNVLTVSGEFIAYSPEGKNTDNSLNSTEVTVTLNNASVDISTLSGTYAVMVSRTGAVTAHPYIVSFSTPEDAIANRMWYDLTTNKLKVFGSNYTEFQGFKLGTLIVKAGENPEFHFHGACQIVDGATLLNEIELAKVPVGTVIAYMGTNIPEGYLLMDGRLLSRTTYSRLFSVIGTTQGAGDGSTTFQIANMTDGRYLMGSTVAGGSVNAGLPNITGDVYSVNCGGAMQNKGALSQATEQTGAGSGSGNNRWNRISIDASKSNSIYGATSTVTPLSMKTIFLIKF